MICIAFYLRSTLGGDANKVHVGDAHANTTPRHSRTAVGAILLLIRLKTQDRRTQSVKKKKKTSQTNTHAHTMTRTYQKKSSQYEPIPSYLLQAVSPHLHCLNHSCCIALLDFLVWNLKQNSHVLWARWLGTGNYLHGMGWWTLPETHQNWWTPPYSFTSFAGLLS